MKKIGLFYGTETKKTTQAAEAIREAFGDTEISVVPIEKAGQDDFKHYDLLIVGASTWFDGELPTYWDELLPELETLKLKNKKVAIFGLGDQVAYPDNFADGIGVLAEMFESNGAVIVGKTATEGYVFTASRALKDGFFQGLVLDFENQPELNEPRIRKWVDSLKNEF